MKKRVLGIVLMSIMIVGIMVGCGSDKEKAEKIGTAKISIEAQLATQKGEEKVVDGGHILNQTTVDIYKGDTPIDALERAAKKHDIKIEYSGEIDKNTAYVTHIDGIAEDTKNGYGWVYYINGEFPEMKDNKPYEIKDKDSIEWIYVDTNAVFS